MTGAVMSEKYRIWLARFLLSALSETIWHWESASSDWLVGLSVSHVLLSCMKKSSVHSWRNTCSTNWRHYQNKFVLVRISHCLNSFLMRKIRVLLSIHSIFLSTCCSLYSLRLPAGKTAALRFSSLVYCASSGYEINVNKTNDEFWRMVFYWFNTNYGYGRRSWHCPHSAAST